MVDCDCEAGTQAMAGGLQGPCQEGVGVGCGAGWGLRPEVSDDLSTDSITPELAVLPATDGPQKLFPVFRRKAEWKVCGSSAWQRDSDADFVIYVMKQSVR